MKKKIISALLAAVMVFSLTACGGGSDKKSADGTCYNTYLDTDPTTMDPVKGNDTYSMGILRNIMEPLTRLEEDGDKQERKGAGAESWESNDDGTVWTFHLRDNKWSDGEPVKQVQRLFNTFSRHLTRKLVHQMHFTLHVLRTVKQSTMEKKMYLNLA